MIKKREMMANNYQQLEARFEEIGILESNLAILNWDKEVYMPVGAAQERCKQLSLITEIIHNKITAPTTIDLCKKALAENLDDWQRANLRLIEKRYKIHSAIPNKLITQLTAAKLKSAIAWRQAREKNDFALVKNELQEVLDLTKYLAQIKADMLGCSIYEVLLDEYEPGLKDSDVQIMFEQISNFITPLIAKAVNNQHKKENISSEYPIEKQHLLIKTALQHLEFDYNKGRLDISAHPFCGGSSSDIRMTTRFMNNDFISGLYGAIHEAGHANYKANLPQKWVYQPVGKYLSMGMHESQSLIYEYQLGKNYDFLHFILPHIQSIFDIKLTLNHLYNALNFIEPSLIRVGSDELTYNLHIMIRYRLEKALIEGSLDLDELPQVWNQEYERILGVAPLDDRTGCLQDIHWFIGCFGYFPTYVIGASAAAQIMHYAGLQNPNLSQEIRSGYFRNFNKFLSNNIHQYGSYFTDLNSLVKHSFDQDFSTSYLGSYFQKKWS